jgi:hypothetical protein
MICQRLGVTEPFCAARTGARVAHYVFTPALAAWRAGPALKRKPEDSRSRLVSGSLATNDPKSQTCVSSPFQHSPRWRLFRPHQAVGNDWEIHYQPVAAGLGCFTPTLRPHSKKMQVLRGCCFAQQKSDSADDFSRRCSLDGGGQVQHSGAARTVQGESVCVQHDSRSPLSREKWEVRLPD